MTESGIAAPRRTETTPDRSEPHYLQHELYELVRSDSRVFDFLQDGSLDGIWYWDLEAPEHEWMSERFWTVLGYEPGEQRHSPDAWQDLINSDDLQVAIENFERHCADPSHPYDQIVRYRHRNGSTVWIRCRGVAIRNGDGRPIRMLGAHTDVTALKSTEEELRRKAAQLESVNTDLSFFAYAASHDLRSPLSTIRGLAELLHEHRTDGLDDHGAQALDHLRETAKRAFELMDRVLQFSKVTQARPTFESVDLNDLVRDVVQDLASIIEPADASVTVESLPTVRGDPAYLRLIVQNLISNSVRYAVPGEPPRITMRGRTETDSWRIEVDDCGIGIAEDDLSCVFDPFQRLDAGPDQPGSGLGLAVVKRVVEMHEGEVGITSEPGDGTTVHFTISRHL